MTEPHPDLADLLTRRTADLARETARLHLARHPEFAERDPEAEQRCAEDGEYHLQHLAAALAMGRPELFGEYVGWAADLLAGFGREHQELDEHLRAVVDVIAGDLGEDHGAVARATVDHALAVTPATPLSARSSLDEDRRHGGLAREVLAALLRADQHAATDLVLQAADAGTPLEELYLDVFQPCLYEVGRLWQTGQASVAQEHFVSAGVQLAMAQLSPRLFATPRVGRAIVVASVGGELHEIGGRMVADMFELHGWHSHFAGANTPSHDIAQLVVDLAVDAVAISATLPSHLPTVSEVVAAIRIASAVPILVGGRPFNQDPDLWQVVAADATATDAVTAVSAAIGLVEAA